MYFISYIFSKYMVFIIYVKVFKQCILYFKEDTLHPHYKYPSLYDI